MRLRSRAILSAILAALFSSLLHAQPSSLVNPTLPRPAPNRIIAKLRPSLAQQVEAELPLATMTLAPGESANAQIRAFFSRHGLRALKPLYPDMVRAKKQGLSDLGIANSLRQRFPKRASRWRAAFQPPEISRTYRLELDDASSSGMERVLDGLRADPDVEFAEPDRFVAVVGTLPNDPYLSSTGNWGQSYQDLWGIWKIGAPTAWSASTGNGVIVAVVDTGIDYTHPDITANVWTDANGHYGWDFIGSDCNNPTQSSDPMDGYGHGTHVAGTIAAVGNNNIGVIGVAWQAKVMAVKGLDNRGCGLDSTLAPALEYAADHGADVINNSWGGPGSSQTLAEAVDYAYQLGVVLVAAAGNNYGDDARNYTPAAYPEVITVAASDPYDEIADFSNGGDKIDVAAPGVDILSLQANGTSLGPVVSPGYVRLDGSSMATPHVSGLAALILAQNPTYSNEDVRQVLRVSATDLGSPGFDFTYGYGRIDAANALTITSVLEAKILSPADGTKVTGVNAISGVTRGNGFAQYKLEYGAGATPTSWTLIQTGTSPASGTLGSFDATQVPDGTYTIRLTAYDSSNHAFVDQIQLVVDYVIIASPAPPAVPVTAAEFKPGAQINIVGNATGPSFKSFQLLWARGINPSSGWSAAGMTLTGGGSSPVSNDVVGTWDTSSVTQADYYTIRLQVTNSGLVSKTDTLVYLEPDLLSANWPVWLDVEPYIFNSGIIPGHDAAGNVWLGVMSPTYLNSSVPPKFRLFSPDGSIQKQVGLDDGSYFQPAAANFDGSGGEQFVVGDGLSLRVIPISGATYAWPTAPSSQLYSQLVLADVDDDSHLEALVVGDDWLSGSAYLYAWRGSGNQLNGNFPLTLADNNSDLAYSSRDRVLVADIDGDGKKEILVQDGTSTSTFILRLYGRDGSPLAWANPVFDGVPIEMILADLDNNGKLEIVTAVCTGSQPILHVLQPDGSERAGWPQVVGTYCGQTYLAVGDLNRDGHEEIVVASFSNLYVFNPDGSFYSGAWPRVTDGFHAVGPLVIADVDGDGYPEILTVENQYLTNPLVTNTSSVNTPPQGSHSGISVQTVISIDEAKGTLRTATVQLADGIATGPTYYFSPQLLALHRDNTIARSWNLLGANGNQPDPIAVLAIGDFDQDGITDIAVSYPLKSGGGAATVLTTGAPFHDVAMDWPMMYQNPRNSAVFSRRAETWTSIRSSANPSPAGAPVAFTATVALTFGGTGTPTGTVNFFDGANNIGSCTLSSGACTFTTSALTLGTHSISATYLGDTSFAAAATATPITHMVLYAASNTTVTSSQNPSVLGQSVTLTASVSALAPATGTPTGTVTFLDGGTSIGMGTLSGGTATLTTSALTVGSHMIAATYGGDKTFASSTGSLAGNPQVVNNADYTTAISTAPSVTAGQTANFTITVTPSPAPYNFAVGGFGCSGLPTGTACTFNPTSVTPGNNPAPVNLSISTTSRIMALNRSPSQKPRITLAAWLGIGSFGFVGLLLGCYRDRRRHAILAMLLLLAVSAALVSCGGGSSAPQPRIDPNGTPAGTYTITVQASGNGVSHTATCTLIVN